MAVSNVELIVDATKAINPLKRVTSETQKLEGATRDANGRLRDAKGRFIGVGKSATVAAGGVRGLGAALQTALGPLTAAFAAATSLSQAFSVISQQDFAEAKVRSLGVNSEQLKVQLQDVSRELSGQASVLDLTSSAYDVASAGFTDAADAAKILKAASQGATGGFSDINTVGDATTSVLNAYGLEADKAAKLVDGFIQTQNDGKIVIGEYAANIAKVAPVAAALGVPLEEVNAAVAQITAGGQGAEVTFTALKTAFAQVAAGKVGKEFEALGVKISASTLKTDGLAGTLEKIKKSGADAGTVIKAFGTEAGPSILALLNNTEKYNQLLENQKQAQGAAAAAAFEASDTIDGQLKRLTTAFQNLFSDQSELGIIIKETFKVAAVTVEVFGVALSNTLAPIRAIFAAANQVGQAVAEALGFKGVNAAFALEQAFQATLGRAAKFGEFVIGMGVRIGKLVGGLASQIITAGKNSLGSVVGFFKTALEKIVGFIGRAYNLIPKPIRDFLEKGVSAATGFVQETIDLGKGVMEGTAGAQQQQQATQNAIQPTNGNLSKKQLEDQKKLEDRKFKLFAIEADHINKMREEEEARNYAEGAALGKRLQRGADLIDQANRQGELLQARIDGNEAEVILKHQIADINKRDLEPADKQSLIDQLNKNKLLEKQIQTAEKLDQVYKSIGSAVSDGIVNALTAAVEGTKSLADVASQTLRQIANILLQFGVSTALQGIPGLGKFFGGGKASGGTVTGGRSYVVGERGPELFTPGRTGSIAPSGSFSSSNIVVNVDASGSNVQGDAQQGKALGQAIGAAVQAELIKQKRPGGLLS